MDNIVKKFGIENPKLYRRGKKVKKYSKISDSGLMPYMHYQADLLMLPTAKYGFKYLLCVTDIVTGDFDMEAM